MSDVSEHVTWLTHSKLYKIYIFYNENKLLQTY